MKLRRLWIEQYRLLRDLDLRFDRPGRLDTGQYALDFLVGVNGSGKSTVLRALAQIVADLRADRTTDFNYTLEYELQGRDGPYIVTVSQSSGAKRHMEVRATTSPEGNSVYDRDSIDQTYLPNRVVVYTTGSEAEWERLLAQVDEGEVSSAAPAELLSNLVQRAVVELPGHLPGSFLPEELAELQQPYLLIREASLPLVTLCGLLAHLASAKELLDEVLKSLGLRFVRGFSLRFRIHSALSPIETFQHIVPLATRHVQQGTDHLLVFDLMTDGPALARNLIAAFSNSLSLFEELDRLQQPSLSGEPTLQEIAIFLERASPPAETEVVDDADPITRLFLLDWLSDGEQSFLGRMALLAMLHTEDSLILLDEPEVHFNDYWKREVVNLLDIVMEEHSNHLLIITHSSITLSDVTSSQVVVMVRDPDGWAQRQFLRIPLLAVDPSDIMVTWFGTERSVGERSTRLLTAALDRGNAEELTRLLNLVGPGYWRYRIEDKLEELRASPS